MLATSPLEALDAPLDELRRMGWVLMASCSSTLKRLPSFHVCATLPSAATVARSASALAGVDEDRRFTLLIGVGVAPDNVVSKTEEENRLQMTSESMLSSALP